MNDTPRTDAVLASQINCRDELAEFARELERELKDAKSQLEAWQSQFRTSQLSHAIAVYDDLKHRNNTLVKSNEWQSKAIALCEKYLEQVSGKTYREEYLEHKWEIK